MPQAGYPTLVYAQTIKVFVYGLSSRVCWTPNDHLMSIISGFRPI